MKSYFIKNSHEYDFAETSGEAMRDFSITQQCPQYQYQSINTAANF